MSALGQLPARHWTLVASDIILFLKCVRARALQSSTVHADPPVELPIIPSITLIDRGVVLKPDIHKLLSIITTY